MMFIFFIYSEYYNYYLFLIKDIRHHIILYVFHSNDFKSYNYIFLKTIYLKPHYSHSHFFLNLNFFGFVVVPRKKLPICTKYRKNHCHIPHFLKYFAKLEGSCLRERQTRINC